MSCKRTLYSCKQFILIRLQHFRYMLTWLKLAKMTKSLENDSPALTLSLTQKPKLRTKEGPGTSSVYCCYGERPHHSKDDLEEFVLVHPPSGSHPFEMTVYDRWQKRSANGIVNEKRKRRWKSFNIPACIWGSLYYTTVNIQVPLTVNRTHYIHFSSNDSGSSSEPTLGP